MNVIKGMKWDHPIQCNNGFIYFQPRGYVAGGLTTSYRIGMSNSSNEIEWVPNNSPLFNRPNINTSDTNLITNVPKGMYFCLNGGSIPAEGFDVIY